MNLKPSCDFIPIFVGYETEASILANPILYLDSIPVVLYGLQGSTRQKRANYP